MQCIICHGDDIRLKMVREEVAWGDDIVRIPIEVMVCNNCGERYYDRRTVRYLEEVERKLELGELPLRQAGVVMEAV